MKKGGSHIAAPSWIMLVSHASLKVAKSSMIEMGLLESKEVVFMRSLIFSTILDV